MFTNEKSKPRHDSPAPSSIRFIDAHVHIKDPEGLKGVAAAGITAVRDAGSGDGAGLRVGSSNNRGLPAVLSAGWALYKKGGYGARFGCAIETREDITREILKLRAAGAAIIKVMASGMVSLKELGKITPGGFSGDELHWIVEEAKAAGLDVMAHANGEQAVIGAAEAGVISIEHGFFMTDRALAILAREQVFWVPTVDALKRTGEPSALSQETREFVERTVRDHLVMIQKAHALGAPLAVGTDCVLPDLRYQERYDAELGYFEQAGISHDEVLAIACCGGAKLLGPGARENGRS